MSSVGLPNSVCNASRTPRGNPLIDVTTSRRSFFKWARNVSGRAVAACFWVTAITTHQRLTTTIAQQAANRALDTAGSLADRSVRLKGAHAGGIHSSDLLRREEWQA